jgi:ferredoxin
VRFTSDGSELEVPPGERLLDVLDVLDEREGLGPMPIACRGATCGSCRVRVERGSAQLVPAAPEERRTLRELGCADDERLACQVVCVGEGLIELRWTGR